MATRTLMGTGAKTVTESPKSDFYQVVEVANDVTALVNELRTDGTTNSTFQTEAKADIGTIATFQAEVVADVINTETFQTEAKADIGTVATWEAEVDADLDVINNYIAYLGEQNGVIEGNYTVLAAAAATLAGTGRVRYRIAGEQYEIAMAATVALTTTTTVTTGLWKAWRVEIDRLGAVTTTTYAGAGVASEQIALLLLGSVALTANTAVLAYWTVNATGDFIPATDNTNGEAAANTHYERMPKNEAAALWAAQGTSLVAGAGLATVAVGASNPKVQGVRVAQIAADATLALTDADTITTTEAGGWLVLTDLAGTGYVTLSSDGVPGVTALTDTDAAGAQTALDALASQLPSVFVPLGQAIVVTAGAATFTAGTTLWDAADVTTTVADQTFGTFDRTATAATMLARQSNPPVVPDSVTAPAVDAMTAVPTATMDAPAVVAMSATPVVAPEAAAVDDFTFRTIGTP